VHGACADKAETACVTDGGGEAPTAAPDHSALDDGVLDVEEFANGILCHEVLNWRIKGTKKIEGTR